jgi:hypothetical protein
MKSQKMIAVAVLLFGIGAALLGLALIAGYFLDAVVGRWGKPDQSLLFWYLPILFMGLGSMAIGFVAGRWGILRLRAVSRRPSEQDVNGAR